MTADVVPVGDPDVADIDLNDTDAFVRGEAHRLWGRLRKEDPVHWNPTPGGGGFWALTTYADVVAALRDFETFSSALGTVIGGSFRNEVDTATGLMLVTSDPPRHRALRRRMQRVFSRRMVRRSPIPRLPTNGLPGRDSRLQRCPAPSANLGSVATVASPITCWQKRCHSRVFWIAR